MATIMPKGENLRRAVKWISASLEEDANAGIGKLIEKAALKFNLSPKDEVYLHSFYSEKGAGNDSTAAD